MWWSVVMAFLMETVVVTMGNTHCATIGGGFGGLGAKGGWKRWMGVEKERKCAYSVCLLFRAHISRRDLEIQRERERNRRV